MKTISELSQKLNLKFNNEKLIQNAFVHRSYLNESSDFTESNERLEYLGDAVLELITSEYLYDQFPKYQEGMLTNLRAALVRTTTLADVATELNLNDLILMSRGEEDTGGRSNQSILANITEALIGSIYLDLGIDAVNNFLKKHLFTKTDSIIKEADYKDSKSLLQEVSQSNFKETPQYILISEKGPDHDKEFTMKVVIGNKDYSTGTGKSKQLAQEAAARETLEILANN